ncbi:MAG: YggT family protein [Asticcacaulis sp.]|uniref:YggT family protein n=1 Tax=Asticcacaulis sp. TaxID=1872648 RepID=UPI003F7C8766
MTDFIAFIVYGLLDFVIFCLIVSAILSWLIAFNVVNTRNRGVYMIVDLLDRITTPVLAPFRAIIPPMGGLDLSFLVGFLVIQAFKLYLLPPAFGTLRMLIG